MRIYTSLILAASLFLMGCMAENDTGIQTDQLNVDKDKDSGIQAEAVIVEKDAVDVRILK